MTLKAQIQMELFAPEMSDEEPCIPLSRPDAEGVEMPDDDDPPAGLAVASARGETHSSDDPNRVVLPRTLGEVLARLRDLPAGQRRSDLISSVNVAAQVLDRPLGSLPAAPSELAPLLAAGRPLLAGLSAQRWSRVRTNLRAALRTCGFEVLAGRDVAGPAPDWVALLEGLPDRGLKHGLSRLFSYFTRAGITTESVSTADFAAFRIALLDSSLHAHPERTFRTAMKCWNAARKAMPSWPCVEAPREADRRRYSMPSTAFDYAFLEDLKAYLAQAADTDPFSPDYHRGLRPATLKQRRLHIMQAASALVASGFETSRLTSLAVLVQADNVEAALRHMRDRHQKQARPQVGMQARTLLTVARHWVKAPEEQLKVLSRFTSALTVTHVGMAPGVQARLRQFDLRQNLNTLLVLPDRVCQEVEAGGPPDIHQARRLMMALAVELLTMTPMRMANLAALSLDRHFQIERRGRTRSLTIWIPEEETKNHRRLVLPVPPSTAFMLQFYWSKYQPLLIDEANAHIFPSRGGRPRSSSALGASISKFIARETGLIMHPHLFRQLAAKLSLESGGGLETARLLLGHTCSETTERHYVHLRTDKAYSHLDATISKLRTDAGLINPQTKTAMRNIHGS